MELKRLDRTGKYFLVLFLFSFALFLGMSFWRGIPSGDETRVAGIAAEMLTRGDWLVPRLNGEYFLEYPAFFYQLSALSMAVFGMNEWAVRLPSLLCGVAGCLLIFGIVKALDFSDLAAFAAGFMLGTSFQYFNNFQECMVDPLLATMILASYYCGILALKRKKVLFLILTAVFLGLGICTKGLVALVLFDAGWGCFLLWEDWSDRKIRFQRYFALAAVNIAALGIAGVWVAMMYFAEGRNMKLVDTVVFVNNFGRFDGSQGDHVKGWYFYLFRLPELFWPWLPFFFWTVYRKRNDRKCRILLCFAAAGFVLLSVASAKRQIYLLPLYAPAAGLCGIMAAEYLAGWRKVVEYWTWAGFLGAVLAVYWGAAVLIALSEEDDRVKNLYFEAEKYSGDVYLYAPGAHERTRGAAYFYRRRRTKIINRDDLQSLPAGSAIIMRDGKPSELGNEAVEFPDEHYLYVWKGGKGSV